MLKYTGHPLVDVGVATITAFAGKQRPEDLTEADLDSIADYIARELSLRARGAGLRNVVKDRTPRIIPARAGSSPCG